MLGLMDCPFPSKQAHARRAGAVAHLRALRRVGGSSDLRVYPCGDHWHVGHSVVSLRRRIRAALRRAS